MSTSKEVFAMRREGLLDEAYQMATQLMSNAERDLWDIKAFAWCLIDLIKRDDEKKDQTRMAHYRLELEGIKDYPAIRYDEVLSKKIPYTIKLCHPNRHRIADATALNKSKRHLEAADIYRELRANGDESVEVQTSLGWELYHLAKAMLEQEPKNFNAAKRHILEFLNLNAVRPSELHSRFLLLADRLAAENKLMLGKFVKLWDLNNLRLEDHEQYTNAEGVVHLSLAERIVQRASKDAYTRKAKEELQYLLPFIDKYIDKFPDNLWLKQSKAKALLTLGSADEALRFAVEVVKNKPNDYWAWGLLGDVNLSSAPAMALSCYCKALLCSKDINFVSNVKLKLADLLRQGNEHARAKLEVDECVKYRSERGQNVADFAKAAMTESWYLSATSATSNLDFYRLHAPNSEALLCANLPWIDGVVGDCFVVETKPDKPRRKIYLKESPVATEFSIPEKKVALGNVTPGTPIQLKGEFDLENRFQVYKLERRESAEAWDIFTDLIGVVDHVNESKKLIHFMVDRQIHGIVKFSELEASFKEGDAIAIRLSSYTSKLETRYSVLHAKSTTQVPPESVLKSFEDDVNEERGMGFTDGGIFITASLMRAHQIQHEDRVSGKACLNYDQKKKKWSWKALSISNVTSSTSNELDDE